MERPTRWRCAEGSPCSPIRSPGFAGIGGAEQLRIHTFGEFFAGGRRDVADDRYECARISGIEIEFGGAGVIVFVEDLAPGFAAIRRFENTASFAGR